MLLMATTAMQTFRDLQEDDGVMSNAQQLKNMIGQIGSAAGVSLATILLQWRTSAHYVVLNTRLTGGGQAYEDATRTLGDAFAPYLSGGQAVPAALGQLAQQLSQQAALLACLDFFALVCIFGLLGALVMVLQGVME
jgi:hypothetical protein